MNFLNQIMKCFISPKVKTCRMTSLKCTKGSLIYQGLTECRYTLITKYKSPPPNVQESPSKTIMIGRRILGMLSQTEWELV